MGKLKIEQTDKQGEPENIITEYNVHTISLVKGPALGINIVKAKAEDQDGVETEEMNILKERIEKAKAKDAQEEAEKQNKEIIEKAKAEEEAQEEEGNTPEAIDGESPGEKAKSEKSMISQEGAELSPEEKAKAEDPKKDDPEEGEDELEESDEPEEKAKSEDDPEEQPQVESEEKAKSEDEQPQISTETVVNPEGEPVEKEKKFSAEELGEAQKAALTAIDSLARKLSAESPDASLFEIFDIIYSAVSKVDDILWWENEELQNKIWEEVNAQVAEKMEKSKSVTVEEATDPVEAMKAFEKLNPALAKVLKAELAESKEKALAAENSKKAALREKRLGVDREKFKRLSQADNSAEMISDSLDSIKTLDEGAHKVISKALDTAANILMAGDLFTEVGSSEENQNQTEDQYVTEKAKSLVESGAKSENGEPLTMAAARANVRQTAEFSALYR